MKKLSFILFAAILIIGVSACKSKRAELEKEVEKAQKELPMVIEPGMVATAINLNGESLVFKYEIDEYVADMDAETLSNPQVIAVVKQALIQSLKSSKDTRELITLCKDSGVNLIFRFNFKNSRQTVDVKIDKSEL